MLNKKFKYQISDHMFNKSEYLRPQQYGKLKPYWSAEKV